MQKTRPNEVWQPEPRDDSERELVRIAEVALNKAAANGASAAEVSLGNGRGISVTVRNGEVETVEHNNDKSLGVTVYFEERSGNASTGDFADAAVEECVDAATNIARFTEADPYSGLADPDQLAREFTDLDLYHPWNLEMDEAIDIATRCEAAATGADKRISNTEGGSVSSHHGSDLLATSDGFRGLSRSSRHSVSCSVIAGKGDSMQRDYWYDSARDRADLDQPEKIGRETARRTLRRLDARKVRTGAYPVIFEPMIAGSLLSHLISAISGPSQYREASFLLKAKGEQIFPASIRIHEQPHIAKGASSAVFDNEGVATSSSDIVTDGVLQRYVLGSYSGRKLGLASTGNAGGVHNLTIEPTTDKGLEEMIADIGNGIVISELIGFGVNNVTGDYSRGAFGFMVENGEIAYPVQEFTIAGNLRDMFQSIEAVGADVDTRRSTRTGSILLGNLTVAGE